ncbi:MAG: ABC transporter permease [Bacteroidota bacterium]|nr:ABC transporter permease [Bacteroidota bacterium]
MNTELFISRRIVSGNKANRLSRPIINIAVLSIALGLAVMIVSVAIVTGFQKQIREKVIGFGAHIFISNLDENSSFETKPVSRNQPFLPALKRMNGVSHVQVYATKAGLIKCGKEIQGVVLKGVGSDYDWRFFKNKIISGNIFTVRDSVKTNDVLISDYQATKLNLKVNENVLMYFIQNPPRSRKFRIAGIYKTGMEEFDKIYVFADIAHVQKLNDWAPDKVSGFEVFIKNFNDLDKMGKAVYQNIGYDLDAQTIKQKYPQIFDWLDLLNMNVFIILLLMVIVSSINMISAFLIMIIERTNMIGILKSLGATNYSVRKIFIYNATYIIGRGLIWGNIIGILLCIIQQKTGMIKLSQESYYVSVVPINLDYLYLILLNIGTMAICLLALLLPSFIITKITPVKAIRAD